AIWRAAQTGTPVDARIGDPDLDRPGKGSEWDERRVVRAEVLSELLLVKRVPHELSVRSIHVQGARISGELNMEGATLGCPLELVDCYFEKAVTLSEASVPSLSLAGTHLPALTARQVVTRGDVWLGAGFKTHGEVDLRGAHIGGQLDCNEGHFQ